MKNNFLIEFNTDDDFLKELYPPRPAIEDLPEWFKDTHDDPETSITQCMPAMDYITSGYIIYNSYEYQLEEKVINFKKGLAIESVNSRPEKLKKPTVFHHPSCPTPNVEKNFWRIDTDWQIKTPPGYSCLIIQPFYEFNKNYQIMPAIVDTDRYDYTLNVKGYLTGKSHAVLPGEKLVQVIPFKRENWTHTTNCKRLHSHLLHYIYGAYRKLFHSKKSYK